MVHEGDCILGFAWVCVGVDLWLAFKTLHIGIFGVKMPE